MTIQETVPLAPLTTLHVGGAARYFAELKREDEIQEAAEFAKTRDLPLFVLGGGSNLVVADSGWPGLVLRIAIGGISAPTIGPNTGGPPTGNAILFSVGAGVNWDDFVAQAVVQNCAGVECLSGIPGSVGGTPVQNVGAYGQEVSDTIESVRAFDLKKDSIVILPKPACGFRYRSSIFNTTERGRYIILRVNYRLKRGDAPSLKYADLQKYFAERLAQPSAKKTLPSLAEVRDAVREIRRGKGMLIVPGDEDCRSAGSFFKNPVLDEDQFKELVARAAAKGLEIPNYPARSQDKDAQHKVSAAWLVEHSGFAKGYVAGAAGISHKHALALINREDAKASDIVALKDEIQRGVQEAWGILLEPEPVFVGF
ncbi:MAG TPA: UDP-N-acetylmuramate dehydrogenase [Terriglobales bacterium]|jgi:UDP-N-acetylmuramate dehydrogenase|nr:UDP-N-acetylmuramate dehydrogenase [Terriglobales bacterium]